MPWNFFRFRERITVDNNNEVVYDPIRFRWAKRIEGLIKVYERMVEEMQPVLKGEAMPFVLAGDHGTAGATIKAIKKAFPDDRIGVVWGRCSRRPAFTLYIPFREYAWDAFKYCPCRRQLPESTTRAAPTRPGSYGKRSKMSG